jgi:hypothetical protein
MVIEVQAYRISKPGEYKPCLLPFTKLMVEYSATQDLFSITVHR